MQLFFYFNLILLNKKIVPMTPAETLKTENVIDNPIKTPLY